MAVHKGIRSNISAQSPHAKHPGDPKPARHRRNAQPTDPHVKANLFDDLRQLNRGYGVALAALHRLHRPAIFPATCLRDYSKRTEELRALANRDLLRLFATREERDAERFGPKAVRR